MPTGYRERLAAPYLAQVYRSGTALNYAKEWIRSHKLQKNAPAQEMLSIMEAVDDSILQDDRDVINSVAFEKLIRRAYGLERAFEDCWLEEDYRRPGGKKQWNSKVKWGLCDRYDLRGFSSRGTRISEADEEAKKAMERDAVFYKYYSKQAEAGKAQRAE